MKNLISYCYNNTPHDEEINQTAFFLEKFGEPYVYSTFYNVVFLDHELNKKNSLDVIGYINKHFNLNFKSVYTFYSWSPRHKHRDFINGMFCDEENKLILKIFNTKRRENYNHIGSVVLLFQGKPPEKLIEFLELYSNFEEIKKEVPKVNILGYSSQLGFYTSEFEIQDSNININENYNDDFEEIDQIVKNFIREKDKSGLVMFHGIPGTGKTFYIRHILKWCLDNAPDNKVIYIPVTMSAELTNPNFIPFLTKQIGATIIIEDAERVITSREDGGGGNAVSGILNLSDGILGDIFKLKIILSFNMDVEKVDSALMRKGRLKAKYEFGKLTQSKSTALLEKLGKNVKADAPMTLTEIFNYDDKEFNGRKEKPRVGFGA